MWLHCIVSNYFVSSTDVAAFDQLTLFFFNDIDIDMNTMRLFYFRKFYITLACKDYSINDIVLVLFVSTKQTTKGSQLSFSFLFLGTSYGA